MVQLILIFTNIFEVAESYLAFDITIDENISISPLQIAYAWMSFAMTIILIAFVRICEIYDKAGEIRHCVIAIDIKTAYIYYNREIAYNASHNALTICLCTINK